MESENGTESNAPPVRLVTVNQIVAWNIAWYRHEAGLKQRELADLLGWPQNKVSEAERSWNGGRTREFDAETLAGLSLALGVPVDAFFLPPLDDGKAAAYMIRPPGQDGSLPVGTLMSLLVSYSSAEGPAANGYRRRLLAATGRYLDGDWQAEVAEWLRPLIGREGLLEGAMRLRGSIADVLDGAEHSTGVLGSWVAALEKAAEGEEE